MTVEEIKKIHEDPFTIHDTRPEFWLGEIALQLAVQNETSSEYLKIIKILYKNQIQQDQQLQPQSTPNA